MAQPIIRDLVTDLLKDLQPPDPVVEFGALQVEAEQDGDLRPLFAGRDFVGTDFRAGPGVDRVEDLRTLSFADDSVGTALCIDTLEHCADPLQAGRELARVTAPGGVCIASSVMLFGIHGYPDDFFRFTPEGMRSVLSSFDRTWVVGVGDPDIPTQVVGVGANGRELYLGPHNLASLAAAQARFDASREWVRVGPLRLKPADATRILARELWRLGRERVSAGGRAARAGR